MLKSAKFKNITNKPKAEILKKKKHKQTNILTPGVLVKGPCSRKHFCAVPMCFFLSICSKKKRKKKVKTRRNLIAVF